MSALYLLLSLVPFLICLFWTVFFAFRYREAHISAKVLFWFMLTAASLYFGHFVVFNRFYGLIPLTDTVYTFATLSVYPIFYLYILSLTGRLSLKNLWVLLPGILVAAVIGVCYALIPPSALQAFLKHCHYEETTAMVHTACTVSMYAHCLMKYVILAEVLLCLTAGFRRLKNFAALVRESYSNTEKRDLREIRNLLCAFVVTSFLSVIADLVGRAFFIDSTLLMLLVMLPFSIMLFLIGYIGNRQSFTIDDLNRERTDETHGVSDDHDSLKARIDRLMREEKLFLQPDLKVSDIAQRLNTNRTYISEALKSAGCEKNLSFPNYVNRFRIEYCLQELQQEKDPCLKDLLHKVGFVSETTFYRAFKKETGMTPKQYLRNPS